MILSRIFQYASLKYKDFIFRGSQVHGDGRADMTLGGEHTLQHTDDAVELHAWNHVVLVNLCHPSESHNKKKKEFYF